MTQQSPREVWNIHQQQDQKRLAFLRGELAIALNDIQRRSLELAISEIEQRIERNSAPEVLADVEARQATHDLRQFGDQVEVAEREAALQRSRELRASEAYRRKSGEYGLLI
jgi:hypothetical protein